jgi:Tol biopolymer transport system component/DNA-binding winged helix-turn-helix (wHTH) protein
VLEETRQVYEFGEFRLDPLKRQLSRVGEVVPLYSKAFDLLLVLVQSGGRDLSKDELLEEVWPGQILEESNLSVNISAVRRALGESAAQAKYIVTVPGVGYRFVARVRRPNSESSGLIIQSQTISQITVEHEVRDDDEGVSIVQPHDPTLAAPPIAGALTGEISPSRSFFKRPVVLAGLVLSLVVLSAASFFVVRGIQQSRAAASHFQQIRLRQLTNDGRVVNAAISPDGKFYVFVRADKEKSSLNLGQMNGEGPIELRAAAEVVYAGLAFAADGSSIYYVLEDNLENKRTLYRLPVLGGVPVKLREGLNSYFAISPDNKRVAFVRSDAASKTRNILISDLDGANEDTALTLPVKRELMPLSLSWSPDGSMIAMGAKPDENQPALGILLLRLADHELKPLGIPQWREVQSTTWLKDGSGIVCVAANTVIQESRQIWFVAQPSGQTRRITNDLNSYDISLSATTDANNVMAVQHQQISNIWTAPADDLSKAKQVTFGGFGRGDGGLGLDWAPNGKIVYVSSVAQSRTIWSMDPDGANAKELTPPGYFETTPSVTGDGRFLVFESNRSGTNEIWRTNIDGSDPKQLTTCGKNFQPNVSPDGKWVFYRSTCEADPGIWRVALDGASDSDAGKPTRLTTGSGSWPWVSPDSKLVAFSYALSTGKEQLGIVPVEGGVPPRLFDVPPLANFRYGIRWTVDGKAISYRDWGSGLWRQPIEGGAPQRIQGLPDEKIYSYGWSRDGKMFAFTRGNEIRDIVLITNSK